jgi:hypothetical protein
MSSIRIPVIDHQLSARIKTGESPVAIKVDQNLGSQINTEKQEQQEKNVVK